ncbi:MAG: OmpA family protein [Rhodospirillales bacterium]|nr:OmpA family protein [Rhodospirillales bacterium]
MRILILGKSLLAGTAAAVFLAGCGATFDYDTLRATQTDGGNFTSALAREYKTFALFERDEMRDWPDAAHFGEKALAAAGGAAVSPESLKQWSLPTKHMGELTAARARLTEALKNGADRQWPEAAAMAQVQFDCWVEQQEENWQTKHIAQCRNGYFTAIDQIDRAFALSRAQSNSAATPAVADGTMKGDEAKSFIILFDFDSASLNTDATEALGAIAKTAERGKDVRVFVSGHTDLAGPLPFNDGLSQRRAEAVSGALIKRGISSTRISVTAHGERRPRVDTPDGVREPRNRRVEITVGPAAEL